VPTREEGLLPAENARSESVERSQARAVPEVQGEPPDSGGRGRILARIAGFAALILGVVLVALVLFSGDSGHSYKLLFETGGQLVPGNQVLVGGQAIGTVDSIDLTDDSQAEVKITVDEPLREGTTATVRATSLSGIANRYVSISPGPNSEPEIPDDSTLTTDKTTSPVDLDQLFDTFDKRTRAGLQDFIQGFGTLYSGNTNEARATYKYFAPSLQESTKLFEQLNEDQAMLSRFLVTGSEVFSTIAERRDDLASLTSNANEAFGAIARENENLARTLSDLPPTFRQANTTFVNLRAALDDLDPLIRTTGEVAPELAPFLRRLRPVIGDAIPVLGDVTVSLKRPGPTNDLADSLRLLPGVERSANKAVDPTLKALSESQHLIEFMRPYSPDLFSALGKLGTAAGYYDLNGHYLRAQPAAGNVFDYNEVTGELEPIPLSQQYDAFAAFDTGPFTRCPGAATQPNAGWPNPMDHPFTDDGNLDGECDPSEVPPGP
jgi:phospholipid/cholesterol/gamma-HCH transport system substrate-binding protein